MSQRRVVSCRRHGRAERPLISVHDVLGFLPDSDSLSDPLCCPIRLSPNRDEGVFLLSHVYDDLLLSAATTAATPSRGYQFEKGNSCCRNVTNFRQILCLFRSINRNSYVYFQPMSFQEIHM